MSVFEELHEEIRTFITLGNKDDLKIPFEINQVLRECELIWHKALVENDIVLEREEVKDLPLYYGQRTSVKKALVSLMGLCIKRSLHGGRIIVQTALKSSKKGKKICICMEDMGISESFAQNLEASLGPPATEESLFYCQNINEIREILESNGGLLQCVYNEPSGRKYTVLLPVLKAEKPPNFIRKGNLVLIPGRSN